MSLEGIVEVCNQCFCFLTSNECVASSSAVMFDREVMYGTSRSKQYRQSWYEVKMSENRFRRSCFFPKRSVNDQDDQIRNGKDTACRKRENVKTVVVKKKGSC